MFALSVIACVLIWAALGWLLIRLGLFARRAFREGRRLAAGLALSLGVGLPPAVFVQVAANERLVPDIWWDAMGRAFFVIVALLVVAAIGRVVWGTGRAARRHLRESRWLAAGLVGLLAVALLALALALVSIIGWLLFYHQ